ncbi:MAG: hypothetical protein H0V39_03405 [Nitrosomonas sp.]|nr:hypothetical protein [Nitrosomonas sp.]
MGNAVCIDSDDDHAGAYAYNDRLIEGNKNFADQNDAYVNICADAVVCNDGVNEIDHGNVYRIGQNGYICVHKYGDLFPP